jgi:protease YdgD
MEHGEFMLKIFVCLLALALMGCKQTEKAKTNKVVAGYNIIGSNDRLKISTNKSYYNMIGRIITPEGSLCTASLIGDDLILTAAHCVWKNGGSAIQGNYKFQLRMQNGTPIATSDLTRVTVGSVNFLTDINDDWAIAKLEIPLGATYGYFGARALNPDDTLLLAGYGDINADSISLYEQSVACKVEKMFDNGSFYHSCDMGHGDSGGPIYTCDSTENCTIVGIVTGQYQGQFKVTVQVDSYVEQYANVGVNATRFINTISKLRLP